MKATMLGGWYTQILTGVLIIIMLAVYLHGQSKEDDLRESSELTGSTEMEPNRNQ